MKNIFKLLFICFAIVKIQAQDMPSIKVGEDKLGITSLDIKVEVVGNIATTTYDMLFYNPTNRVLEGELSFPLGEDQNVSRLALDVNGNLREAVVVEKEQGRVAFEAVVRRGVDPILLEKGTGNNYKARIYPIFSKKYKRIVLAYEQELILNEKAHYFQLPLSFKKNLDHFSFTMNVFDQKLEPSINEGNLENFKFNNVNKNYTAKFEKENYTPSHTLTIKIPQEVSNKTIVNEDFFYVYKKLNSEKRTRKKSKSITLFWDVSLSMQNRDLEKEISFLNDYLKYLENVKVKLVSFSNTIIKENTFRIEDGNWSDLKMELANSIYDGGTSYQDLFNTITTDEVLLFSDGMRNLSEFSANINQPIYVVNSIIKANHVKLNSISEATNGKYINLKNTNVNDAIDEIKYQAYKFLGVSSNNKNIEFYPNQPRTVSNDFSITGKGFKVNDVIILNFGYGNEIIKKEEVTIVNDVENKLVKRIWAQQKLKMLELKNEENKTEIISHSKRYNVISNHTSLIVLETVWDYVKYKITPPEELFAEYNTIIDRNKNKKIVSGINIENKEVDVSLSTASANVNGTVFGTITDQDGLPLPGVNVLVKGTSNGAITDFDGNYTITATTGNTLVFSYVGSTSEVDVTNSSNISFSIPENNNLDEVVITALGINRKPNEITSSQQIVTAKQLKEASNPDVISSLQGKVSGLQITQDNNGVNSKKRIILRGNRSFFGKNEALIVIDGVVSSTQALSILNPDTIRTVNIIKGANGAALYGSQAVNGVIIVDTTPNQRNRSFRSVTNNSEIVKPAYKGCLKVKVQTNTAEYIKALSKAKNVEQAYKIYLEQRDDYSNVPAYYIDVYDFFTKYKNKTYSQRILSNIAEIDFDNYELLRVFAYKLEAINNYKLASFIFDQVLKLRPEDSQSYRDLALAYQEIGENQKAFDLLNKIVSGAVYKNVGRRKFEGIETISKNEINKLIQNASKVNKESLESFNKIKTNFDVRVVIDWNHNDTDIDLHIIDPNLEECSYKNVKTQIGGEISKDMTQGFGPEEFTIKKAKEGFYFVKVNYFGDRYQKTENPTFMKVTIFRNFGESNETKEIKVVRLSKSKSNQIVAKIEV
ncbi:VIT domain-containing protein [Lacinutrix algicola]|uniref:VIT domain-containing protein n=1 Tax=Lacinutrix algicola TaxID=342954 RepID=UPI0009F85FFA|nr:VIT domain-containing protein [Lacinutrix algicola]